MTGIPDPGRASGYFGALARTETTPTEGAHQMFAFGDMHLRVLRDAESEPLFVATDVARALGYRDAYNMTRRLDADEVGTHSVSTPGGDQAMTVITEPGLYAAILGSQIEGAQQFKRWIKHDVLPEIRRTGSYSPRPAAPAALPSKRELARWVIEAEERAELAESQVRELSGPASSWNELAEAQGDYSVADAAKVLSRDPAINTGERRLFAAMAGMEWIYRRGGRWNAYQAQIDNGRLVEKVGKPFWHERREEWVVPAPTIRVTPKGIAALHKSLARCGSNAQPTLAAVE